MKKIYSVKLPAPSPYVIFINTFRAKTWRGSWWLLCNALRIKRTVRQFEGCLDVHAGLFFLKEAVIVSYWRDDDALQAFYHSDKHQKWMRYLLQQSRHFSAANEYIKPNSSGRYMNEPMGLAKCVKPESSS